MPRGIVGNRWKEEVVQMNLRVLSQPGGRSALTHSAICIESTIEVWTELVVRRTCQRDPYNASTVQSLDMRNARTTQRGNCISKGPKGVRKLMSTC